MTSALAAAAPGRFLHCHHSLFGRIVRSSLLPPLAIRVTLLGAGIANPCIAGKPLVRASADRTKRAAEEDRHRTKSRTVNVHAGGNALSGLGTTDNDYAHFSALTDFYE
jgi:hypothetical protein